MKRKINFLMALLLFGVCLVSAQQNLSVSGVVTDASDGSPMVGVSVMLKGTTNGTITDVNGKYNLNAPQGSTIIFSYIGMEKQEIPARNNVINVKLQSDSRLLDEVVAVGYGTMKKKIMTGATVQVKGDDLQKLNTTSSMAALQGTTSGVQITKSDGQPGDGLNVIVRGIGTIGQTQPLYVVDGVPVGNNIDYLSPSDIESIDVLKDATAAIYGSRAANGVVLVTTRQGSSTGKTVVSYDGTYGVQNVYKKLPLLNAQQYLMIANEAEVNSGKSPFSNAYILGSSLNALNQTVPNVPYGAQILAGTYHGTNWFDAFTNKNAPIQSHALNIAGGNSNGTYTLGVSYINQDGIMGGPAPSNYERYNIRLNSDHKVISNKDFTVLRVGENMDISYNQKQGVSGSGSVYWNDVNNMIVSIPLQPLYDPSTPGKYSYSIPFANLQSNPIGALMSSSRANNISKNYNLVGNIYAELQPIRNLIFLTRFSVNGSASSYRAFTPQYNLSSTAINANDNASQSMSAGLGWIWENTVSYKFSTDQHNFSFLAGTSAERDGLGESVSGQNAIGLYQDFAHAYLVNYPNVSTVLTSVTGSPWGVSSLNSYFGRVNYDYKGTYMLSAIVRSDGSSNFNTGHRWGTFPSFSGGWVVSNESFMKEVTTIDFLKLRASWGQNGNNAISPFQYLAQIGTNYNSTTNIYPNYYFGADNKTAPTVGSYPAISPNLDIKWETSEQTDLGLDATLLNNRLSLTFDYYDKVTKDWLVTAPIPAVVGTSAPAINGGNIENKGYEFSLGWRDHIGDLKYNITGNISFNHNEVTKINNGTGFINGPTNVFGNSDFWYRAQVGYPIGYFYGYKTDGIFQSVAQIKAYVNKAGQEIQPNAVPGDVKFVDLNGNGTIDAADRTKIGDPNPAFNYGVTAKFEYKGFDLSIVGTGVGGNQIAQCTDFEDPILSNNTTDIFARWHGEGTSNFLPRVTASPTINTQYFSDIYMRNGDYFKIANVTLGYDFVKLFRNSIPVNQARLYVQVQNLYTFTKYSGMDPEVSYAPSSWASGIDIGQYPSARTVLVGVNVKF
ncbi:MAG: TonB-dependent receptor [Paludibacter sp.]|nr:TonB-dependent receptor [Paludibacter sp.]